LCGIMDKEHYDALEIAYRKIIDAYFMFKIWNGVKKKR
jgi:hypothetical protein